MSLDDVQASDLKLAIVQIHGKLDTMAEIIKSGDREAQAGVGLLAQTVDNVVKEQAVIRHEIKESFGRVYDRLDTLKRDTDTKIKDHLDDKSPHADSNLIEAMQEKIDKLTTRANLATGAVGVLMFIGLPGIYTILKATGQ